MKTTSRLVVGIFTLCSVASSFYTSAALAGHHEEGEQAASAPEASETGFIAQAADEIELQPVPGLEGLTAAILYGNPDESGPYVIRVRFDKDVRSPPHSHNQDRFITVIDGTWHFGIGASGRCEGTTPLPAGSFAFHPKGELHYDGSCGEPVTVEIRGQGPVSTDFIQFN
jgi:quercetin dioxygenase-like cupin family protein